MFDVVNMDERLKRGLNNGLESDGAVIFEKVRQQSFRRRSLQAAAGIQGR